MWHNNARFILFLFLFWGWGCGGDEESEIVEYGDLYPDDRSPCVDKINQYRATLNLSPLQRWEEGESCADIQAQKDAKRQKEHSAFNECGESAQNECFGTGAVQELLDSCLEAMWAEGPGEDFAAHGHYLNMSSTEYTHVACGFYLHDNGELWTVQNFK